MLIWTVRLLAAAVVAATALPLFRKDAWWIRACEFPRAQILAAGIAVLFAVPYSERSIAAVLVVEVLVGASAVLQALRVLPFTPLWRSSSSRRASGDARESFSVLVSNVLMPNRQVESFLDTVRDCEPDVILILEADVWWRDALEPLRDAYPHAVEQPQEDTYGMLLYSKFRLEGAEIRYLVHEDVPSLRCRMVLPTSRRIRFYGLHPKPPAPEEATRTTARDAELLIVAREVRRAAGPTVVAGDFNDVPWSKTARLFRRLGGLLDPRIGRRLLPTFPAARPLLRFPLDHVYHSPDLGLGEFRRLAVEGSDHLSIYTRLLCDMGPGPEATAPTPGVGDLEIARQTIGRGLERAE